MKLLATGDIEGVAAVLAAMEAVKIVPFSEKRVGFVYRVVELAIEEGSSDSMISVLAENSARYYESGFEQADVIMELRKTLREKNSSNKNASGGTDDKIRDSVSDNEGLSSWVPEISSGVDQDYVLSEMDIINAFSDTFSFDCFADEESDILPKKHKVDARKGKKYKKRKFNPKPLVESDTVPTYAIDRVLRVILACGGGGGESFPIDIVSKLESIRVEATLGGISRTTVPRKSLNNVFGTRGEISDRRLIDYIKPDGDHKDIFATIHHVIHKIERVGNFQGVTFDKGIMSFVLP